MENIKKTGIKIICMITICVLIFPYFCIAISVKDEKELSIEFMKAVKKRFKLIQDPLILNYVRKLGNVIVASLPPQPFEYTFNVVIASEYNAFAGPGAKIFVNSGLIAALDNEEELASIIGHEIAHVVCRHISEGIDTSKKIQIGTVAGIIAGILLGASGGGGANAGSALAMGSMAAGHTAILAFTRENEMQADQIGLKYLNKAGYSGKGLYTSMKKIRSKQYYGPEQVPTYLMTHPAPKERMLYLQSWMDNNKDNVKNPVIIDSYQFDRVKYTVIGKYGDEDNALIKFKELLKKDPNNPLLHYGYALVLIRKNMDKQAILNLKMAVKENALDFYILKELGLAYFRNGQYHKASNILKGLLEAGTMDLKTVQNINLILGQCAMERGENFEASRIFRKIILQDPEFTKVYYFLGESLGKSNDMGLAHYNLGIYNKKIGAVHNALFHLRKSAKLVKNSEKLNKIEKMLKELEKKRF